MARSQNKSAVRVSSRSKPLDVHLNLNVRGLRQSATIAINDRDSLLRSFVRPAQVSERMAQA